MLFFFKGALCCICLLVGRWLVLEEGDVVGNDLTERPMLNIQRPGFAFLVIFKLIFVGI